MTTIFHEIDDRKHACATELSYKAGKLESTTDLNQRRELILDVLDLQSKMAGHHRVLWFNAANGAKRDEHRRMMEHYQQGFEDTLKLALIQSGAESALAPA